MMKLSMISASCSTAFLLLGSSLHQSNAFVGPSIPTSALHDQSFSMTSPPRNVIDKHRESSKTTTKTTTRAMIPDSFGLDFVLNSEEEIASFFPWIQKAEDPTVEAGLLSGMAHVALDFSGFFNPSKQMLRLCAVVGRLFVISADYLPDHSINQGELMIQLFLLSITMKDLLQFGMKLRTPP